MRETMKPQWILAGIVLFVIHTAVGRTPSKIENFSLKDYNGKTVSLSDYKDAKAIVVMFIATKCPVSNAYNQRMESLYDDYTAKHVAFIGINSNKSEPAEEIRSHANDHGLKFTILKDVNNTIADKLDAGVTPEIFVLDPQFNVLYHGRIDDSMREANVESRDLRNALNEILTGKAVTVVSTKAFGCSIKRVK
jgi:peroxiredoxin